MPEESSSPIDFKKKVVLGSKSASMSQNNASIETDNVNSNRRKDTIKSCLITDEIVTKLENSMSENLKCLEQ